MKVRIRPGEHIDVIVETEDNEIRLDVHATGHSAVVVLDRLHCKGGSMLHQQFEELAMEENMVRSGWEVRRKQ